MFTALSDSIFPILKNIALGGLWVVAFLNVFINTYVVQDVPRAPLLIKTGTPIIIEQEQTITENVRNEIPETGAEKKDGVEISMVTATPVQMPQESQPEPPISTASETSAKDTTLISAPEETLIPQAKLNEDARSVIVNIFCLTKTASILEPITGSGVVISEKGVILTNAHVAQYLLLKDYKIPGFLNCVARGGSPAKPLYKIEILYLPPVWIDKNAGNIRLDSPKGTGENDYALLYITEPTQPGAVLPESIPSVSFDTSTKYINANEPVLIASYPAGFLSGLDVTKNFWMTSSVVRMMQIFTFRETPPYTEDAFSLGGTILAQEGASGGGVFSFKTGKLLGVLATSILGGKTDERDLRAVTLRHIDESIQKYTGENLETFLSGDLKQKSAVFNGTIAPQLTQILTDVLEK